MPDHKNTPDIPFADYKPTIVSNPDGTYTRLLQIPDIPATSDPNETSSLVLTKDIPINPINQTWLRIYLPRHALDKSFSDKLPLIVYYHGGGFVFCSPASSVAHDFCLSTAEKVNAVVVSVDYRLAPEHRLPAAYEDAIEALHLVKTCQDDWLQKFSDLSECFLMGSSAGGNIAFHAGLRVIEGLQNLYPLEIKGLILHHPFFGGLERTESELKMFNDPVVPVPGSDLMWELALPVGADRDHEYCNPMTDVGLKAGETIQAVGFRVLITGCDGDPLIYRQVELAKMLKEKGVKMVTHFGEGCHCVEVTDQSKAEIFFHVVKDFMS